MTQPTAEQKAQWEKEGGRLIRKRPSITPYTAYLAARQKAFQEYNAENRLLRMDLLKYGKQLEEKDAEISKLNKLVNQWREKVHKANEEYAEMTAHYASQGRGLPPNL